MNEMSKYLKWKFKKRPSVQYCSISPMDGFITSESNKSNFFLAKIELNARLAVNEKIDRKNTNWGSQFVKGLCKC